MYKICFIGNKMEVPEFLSHDPDIFLKFMISESEKVDDDLITFSLVRRVKLHLIKKKAELYKLLKNKKLDFCVMYSFGKKVPTKAINLVDIYNIHLSYLPYYKGRHPLHWATINNERNIGISLHKVVSKIDSGEIISQKKIPYYLWMSAQKASSELIKKVPDLICELKEYLKNERKGKHNPSGNYHHPVSEQDIEISLENDSPDKIYNKVRSQRLYKGGKLILDGETIWIKKMSFTKSPTGKRLKLGEKYYDNNGNLCFYYKKGISIKLIEYNIE